MATGGLPEEFFDAEVTLDDEKKRGKLNAHNTLAGNKYNPRESYRYTGHNQSSLRRSVNRHEVKDSEQLDEDEKNELFAMLERTHVTLSELQHVICDQEDEPDRLLTTISETSFGLFKYLGQKSLSAEECFTVVKIIFIVSRSNLTALLRPILSEVETEFIGPLDNCLNMIVMKMESHSYIWNDIERLSTFCKMAIDVLIQLIIVNSNALEKYKRILGAIKSIHSDFVFPPEIQFESEMKMAESTFIEIKTKHHRGIEKKLQPPNDFRSIEIFPSVKELHGLTKPFLRKNITQGTYEDLQTYLDIHFRLLREDYVRQFRIGIMEYRNQLKGVSPRSRIREIRVYQNVQMAYPDFSSSGVNYILEFSTGKRLKAALTKCLLTGSLVCISSDGFSTFFYGVVTDSSNVASGRVAVHLEKDAASILDRNQQYTMAEATALFAAYHHVLLCLQGINELPFQTYILYNHVRIRPPLYLVSEERTMCDFACLYKKDTTRPVKVLCRVLDTDTWPDAELVGLDTSQYDAIKAAVTQELVIIQGPPGTGKTYIGLKIAKFLSRNLRKIVNSGPILVVCYTNHALDQFLEGVYSFCKNIIRLGRSKSDLLQECLYFKHRNRIDISSKEVREMRDEHNESVKQCQKSLKQSEEMLKKSYEEILPLRFLMDHMTPQAKVHFANDVDQPEINTLETWLGVNINLLDEAIFEHETPKSVSAARTFFSWCQHIMELTTERTTNEPFNASSMDLWLLRYDDRVRLYKYWVYEVSCEIERHIQMLVLEERKNTLKEVHELESFLISFNTGIPAATQILCHVTNIQTWNEIFSLRQDGMSIDDALVVWLAIDVTETSIDAAEETLKYIHGIGSEYTFQTSQCSQNNLDWIFLINKRRKQSAYRYLLKRSHEREHVPCKVDMNYLTYNERFTVYNTWVSKLRVELQNRIHVYEQEFHTFPKKTKYFENLKMAETLRRTEFIGMTTTKAAMHADVLELVAPKVVIVEEAAEVLEAHIISSLNSKCQHLILIGDHKQLRPSITIYELSKTYKLDISLFERLVQNQLPCVTLTEQHRMRPEISKLMRHPNLYPNLKDHANVGKYEDVKGFAKNVVFLNHNFEEDINEDTLSYTNLHEAEFILALLSYTLKQGYTEQEITVISPYVGQVMRIRNMTGNFRDITLTTIDNYQGEENQIVIISLVRSRTKSESKRTSIGFVGIENRICVALSRAKIGLFAIGNFDHLRANSSMWDFMAKQMKLDYNLLQAIPLQCQNHPENITNVRLPEDFAHVANGGCDVPCKYELTCGHQCQLECHLFDKAHCKYKCRLPCPRTCTDGHECRQQCYEECKCCVLVEKTLPNCKHIFSLPCHKNVLSIQCNSTCNAVPNCGHVCKRTCYLCNKTCMSGTKCEEKIDVKLTCDHTVTIKCSTDRSSVKCPHKVIKTLPCGHLHSMECHMDESKFLCKDRVVRDLQCGHSLEMTCHSDVTKAKCQHIVLKHLPCGHTTQAKCFDDTVECKCRCESKLLCGHTCIGSCKGCYQGRIHKGCGDTCKKRLACGHFCSFPCSIVCPPCSQTCLRRCEHSVCKSLCLKQCEDCHKKCFHKCEHKKCKHLCYELCSDIQCEEPCRKKLSCSHICNSICGEKCVCIRCSDKQNIRHVEYKKTKLYLQLPDCNCIVDVKQLDGSIMMDEKDDSLFKRCPYDDCGKVIHTDVKRYTNVLKACRERLSQMHLNILGGRHRLDKRSFKLVKFLKQRVSKESSEKLSKEVADIKTVFDVDVLSVRIQLLEKLFPDGKQCPFSETMPPEIMSITDLERFIIGKGRGLTHQFQVDIENELTRIRLFTKLIKMQSQLQRVFPISDGVMGTVAKTRSILTQPTRLTKQDRKNVSELFREANEMCDFCGRSYKMPKTHLFHDEGECSREGMSEGCKLSMMKGRPGKEVYFLSASVTEDTICTEVKYSVVPTDEHTNISFLGGSFVFQGDTCLRWRENERYIQQAMCVERCTGSKQLRETRRTPSDASTEVNRSTMAKRHRVVWSSALRPETQMQLLGNDVKPKTTKTLEQSKRHMHPGNTASEFQSSCTRKSSVYRMKTSNPSKPFDEWAATRMQKVSKSGGLQSKSIKSFRSFNSAHAEKQDVRRMFNQPNTTRGVKSAGLLSNTLKKNRVSRKSAETSDISKAPYGPTESMIKHGTETEAAESGVYTSSSKTLGRNQRAMHNIRSLSGTCTANWNKA